MKNYFGKNAFDWIVYILAWLVFPFFPLFFLACTCRKSTFFDDDSIDGYSNHTALSLLRGKNWEERRRKNLYLVIELILFIATFVLPILFLSKSTLKDSGIAAAIIIPFGFLVGILLMYSFWEAFHLYEKHIESRSYEIL